MQFTMRAVRVSCGYAEDEVARYCGVSTETINELEIDSGQIDYNLLSKLINLYGVTLDLIYLGSETDCRQKHRNDEAFDVGL